MNLPAALRSPKRWSPYAAGAFFCVWAAAHSYALTATQNGSIRFFLTAALSLLILLRAKKKGELSRAPLRLLLPALLCGAGLAIAGIVFAIHQVEWIGILLVLYACLRWGLPEAYGPDVFRALFLLYWAHPLPGGIFGPLQLAMQELSVRGSEWLLHLFNVRVWADGLVLRTGYNTFEIPEWCSGLRTATTLFLLAWGLGVLRRLLWFEAALLVAAGLAQALALNIVRISAMVTLAPKTADPSGFAFLHNTGGFVLVAAVFLVAVEAGLLRRWQERRAARRADYAPGLLAVLTGLPLVWPRLIRNAGVLAAALLLALLAGLLAYKSRPEHRINMIRGAAVALRDSKHLPEAERAARLVLAATPGDDEWRLTLIRVLLLRGKNAAALREIGLMPARGDLQRSQLDILRAYALIGMKEFDEAAAVVAQLPEEPKRNEPRVAIILAEIAARTEKPAQVAEHVVVAARWRPNDSRIRELYPYLGTNRMWDAIARSDSREPYTIPLQAFAAMEAYMNLNRLDRLADIALEAYRQWPVDPRILEPLFLLALREGAGAWEERFATHLRRCAQAGPAAEALLRGFDKCFQLARPDLAWQLYDRLSAADPSNPSLLLQVAQYGNVWFTFRRQFLGLSASLPAETIDLRPQFLLGAQLPAWRAACARVPLGKELSRPDLTATRKRILDQALEEFKRRDAAGHLSVARQYDYVTALEVSLHTEEARALLQQIEKAHPERAGNNRLLLSEIQERKQDWPAVYETLRDYAESPDPQLNGLLRLCRAQRELRLGLAAMFTARDAARRFPGSGQALLTLSETLIRFDSHEEALLSMGRSPAWLQREQTVREAECLWATQRFKEAEEVRRMASLPNFPQVAPAIQRLVPPPAELALLWHRVLLPAQRDFDDNALRLRQNLSQARSPFLSSMMQLWLDCYAARGKGPAADISRWESAGRDRIEKATALNQLSLLLCHAEKLPEARAAAEAAARCLPEMPLSWRLLLSLSGADMDVVRRARAACPQDSELWLAELVASTQTNAVKGAEGGGSNVDAIPRNEPAVQRFLAQSFKAPAPGFSPVAIARAGEYLFRIGMYEAASQAAHEAILQARSYLPAYVLGVRCALQKQDKDAALQYVQQAINASLDPPQLFYENYVRIRSSAQPIATDSDMVNALRNLRRLDPKNPLWAEMLGYVSHKLSGVEMVHVLFEMTAAIEGGSTRATPYVIASEAARYIGNMARAEDLLREGLAKNPDNLALLNNLTYLLGSESNTVEQALQILPGLLQRAPDDLAVLDTAAVTYLTAAKHDRATELLDRMESLVARGTVFWFRARTHRAEMLIARRQRAEAELLLEDLQKTTLGIPSEDVMTATSLLDGLKSAGKGNRAPARKPSKGLAKKESPTHQSEPADFVPARQLE